MKREIRSHLVNIIAILTVLLQTQATAEESGEEPVFLLTAPMDHISAIITLVDSNVKNYNDLVDADQLPGTPRFDGGEGIETLTIGKRGYLVKITRKPDIDKDPDQFALEFGRAIRKAAVAARIPERNMTVIIVNETGKLLALSMPKSISDEGVEKKSEFQRIDSKIEERDQQAPQTTKQ